MSTILQYDIPEYLVKRQQARRGERTIQILALSVFVVGLAASAALLPRLDTLRRDHQLALDPTSTRGLPPGMSLLTKTGTFRALVIDFAFMRLDRLKQEGKYYELSKLSALVCTLAPRFPTVWKYAAWNLSYNVSVTQYTPEGRWYWVRKGIDLLRKQGIPKNEKSIGLYLELAYIFWHKVGDFLDDQHWNYKKELAAEVERVLGPPPPALNDRQLVEAFAAIAEAPARLQVLLDGDPEVASVVGKLTALGLTADRNLLDFIARHVRNEVQVADVLRGLDEYTERTEHQARVEYLTAPEHQAARDRLLACLRHVELRDQFNMDPAWMLSLMREYGPLDWRAPYMHALYWSSKGDMVTRGQLDLDENDSMNTGRYLIFGLKLTCQRGKLVFEPNFDDPKQSYLELLPDSRFIRYTHYAHLKIGKEQFKDDPRFQEGTAGPNYAVGHYTFLGDAIRQLYTEGGEKNVAYAQELYDYLRTYNRNGDGSPQEQYLEPLEKFVMRDFYDDLGSFKTANAILGAWIYRSIKYLSVGEVDVSIAAMSRAKLGWEYYMKDKYTDVGDSERRHLAPLKEMRADAVEMLMTAPEVAVIHKVRLWKALDLPTRQMTYDRLLPYLLEVADAHQPPLDADKAFAEPPGMEEFRAQRPTQHGPDEAINQGEKG